MAAGPGEETHPDVHSGDTVTRIVYDFPTTTDPLKIRRLLGRSNWSTPVRFGLDGWRYDHLGGEGSVIVTAAPADDGHDWIHASVAWRDRMPTYEDLKWLHAAVFGDGWAYQVFAPSGDHVNIHEHALHLWGHADGTAALPDFTHGTGSI